MRGAVGAVLVGGLLGSMATLAGGYYPHPPSGREVIWPPPGGLYQVQPPAWSQREAAGSPFREMPRPQRYLPSYRYRGEFIEPPGPDWPGTDYPEPGPAEGVKPPPLQPGHPVEVVPPPGIPVEEVKQQLSRQPQRGWRPVERGAKMPMEPPQPSAPGKEEPAPPAGE